MNILKLLFQLFILYLLYKLVFELVIPAFQATRQMKNKVAEMQARMREEAAQREKMEARPKEKAPAEDYIDFEEVK